MDILPPQKVFGRAIALPARQQKAKDSFCIFTKTRSDFKPLPLFGSHANSWPKLIERLQTAKELEELRFRGR
jgi:hypothetical protein